MPRKKRKTAIPKLPLSTGEVWEVGQRPMMGVVPLPDDSIFELPAMLLVAQAASGRPIFGTPTMPNTPRSKLVDHIRQAMHEPMFGDPRRPEIIRVSSEAEADVLRTDLGETDIAVEVVEVLKAVDNAYTKTMSMFGNASNDYRTTAAAVGDTLSDAALRALYSAAQQFYRKALWEEFDDSEIFSIIYQTADGQHHTHYGVLMGVMEEEFSLGLYPSLEDLQQVYDIDIETPEDVAWSWDEEDNDEAWDTSVDMAEQLLSVPSINLTYTPKRELPQPLADEAKALKLPVAKQSAYPLIMRTGQGIQLADLADLYQIFVAIHAILAWDKQVENLDLEDELDETLTVEIPAMADAMPASTVDVTLVVNPFTEDIDLIDMDEDDFEDDDFGDDDFEDDEEPVVSMNAGSRRGRVDPSLLDDLEEIDSSAPTSKAKNAASTTGTQPPTAPSHQLYTLKVFLTAGPIDESEDEEISREILLLGHHTLHDLHLAIFDAFERREEHLYEFNLGSSPQDQSRLFFYNGGWSQDNDDTGDPTTTALEALDLSESQYFGYTFDMGDQWEHVIEVISIKSGPSKGTYPRIGNKIGAAPPQYPNDDEDDDE